MTISSLVLTLSDDMAAQRAAIDHLSKDPRVILGSQAATRLPLVLETRSAREGADAAEALLEVTGVTFVDVVAVLFDGPELEK